MIYANKKQGESNERLISRFKQIVQRSRNVVRAKQGQYHSGKPTKKFVRQAAVLRAAHRTRKAREKFLS